MLSLKRKNKIAAGRAQIRIPIQRNILSYQEYAARHDPIGFMQRIMEADKKIKKDRLRKVVEFTGKESTHTLKDRIDRRYHQYYKI